MQAGAVIGPPSPSAETVTAASDTAIVRTRALLRSSAPAARLESASAWSNSARSTMAAFTRSAATVTELPSGATNRAACVVSRMVCRGMSSSAKASRPRRPVQWAGMPMRGCSSSTTTSCPRAARWLAAISQAGPAPTITTSRKIRASVLAATGFPCAMNANPKRDQNQSHVEPPRAVPHVDPIVAELVPARYVARRVHLRDAGQPGAHRHARGEPGHILQPFEDAAPPRFDLAGPQRPRPHKAHVAAKDVPQLRELVHRGRAQEAADARHPGIVLRRLDRADPRLGVGAHRTELERHERMAREPDALLAEEHRTAVLHLDRGGEHRPQRRRRDEARPRKREVERALQHAAASAYNRSRRSRRRPIVNSSSTRARPAAPNRARSGASAIRRSIAAPSAPASPAATTRPVC